MQRHPDRFAVPGFRRGPAVRPGASRVRRRLLLLGVLPLWSFACRMPPQAIPTEKRHEARAEDLLLSRDYEGAVAAFHQLAGAATSADEKARAYLGAARAYIKMGSFPKALDSLYTARRLSNLGLLRGTAESLIGEAAFGNKDYAQARGYLQKSLSQASGEERSTLLVQLHVCAVRTMDPAAAQRYLAEAPQPLAPELREILRQHLEPAGHPSPAPSAPIVRRAPLPEPPASGGSESQMQVIPRQSWDARPVRRNVDMMGKINCVTIHHSGGPTFWGKSASEAAYEIRKIQKFHQNENRWADIGYHYLIDRMGRVWQGRPLQYQGAHAHGSANRGNIGVAILGNYLHQEMTESQLRALRRLVGGLCGTYGINRSRIYTHSEIRDGHTDCPGPAISRAVEELRRTL